MVTELAVAFVYREVVRSNSSMEGAVAKRKAGIFITVFLMLRRMFNSVMFLLIFCFSVFMFRHVGSALAAIFFFFKIKYWGH